MVAVVALLTQATQPTAVLAPPTPQAWFAVLWLGLLGSGVAHVLLFTIIRWWGAGRATLVTYLMPVVGIALGVIVLAESLLPIEIVGTAMIISGLLVANSRYGRRPLYGRAASRGHANGAGAEASYAAGVTSGSIEQRTRGRLFVGTSGFSYSAWAPRFYAPGTRSGDLLRAYAARLNACELNNTFYQQPTAPKVAAWLAATPDGFRFSVKAQRGGSWRSMAGFAAESVPWLTQPYRLFGERLGTVLFRVPDTTKRDDGALAQLLGGVAGGHAPDRWNSSTRRGWSTRRWRCSWALARRCAQRTWMTVIRRTCE